jgi:inner membrane protein
MLFRTHLLFSLLIGTLVLGFFDINPFLFVALVVLGGMLPDIDSSSSKINKILKVTKPIAYVVKHRGIFHSIFIGSLFAGVIAFYVNNAMGIALLIGYLGHLLLDGLNYAGVNLIHPFQKLHISGFIETGTMTEHVITITLGILFLIRLKFMLF